VVLATWEGRFWVAMAVVGCALKSLRESIPVLYFLSCYALAGAAQAKAQAAKANMRAEEAAEAGES
jgi:hypothetical protein